MQITYRNTVTRLLGAIFYIQSKSVKSIKYLQMELKSP